MGQSSAPLIDEEFDDEDWRAIHDQFDGIISPYGSPAYSLSLPSSGDILSVLAESGSTAARSRVAGFLHTLTTSEPLTIPAATGQPRTDAIVVRYKSPAAWADTGVRPCRLIRVAGTPGAGAPTLDTTPPGAQDMPLWLVTRSPGQALNVATLKDLRRWVAPPTTLCRSDNLPASPVPGMVVEEVDTGTRRLWSDGAWVNLGSRTRSVLQTFAPGPAIVGDAPGPPSAYLAQSGIATVTCDSNGGATLDFPSAFPSGLLSVTLTGVTSGGADTFVTYRSASRSQVVLICYHRRTTDGVLVPHVGAARVIYHAVGW